MNWSASQLLTDQPRQSEAKNIESIYQQKASLTPALFILLGKETLPAAERKHGGSQRRKSGSIQATVETQQNHFMFPFWLLSPLIDNHYFSG